MAGAFFSMFMRSGNSHNCCSACEKPADLVVKVEGMSCGNCANAVSRAISDIAGVASVKVMLTEKQAMIYGTSLKKDEIVNAINSLGYTAKVEN
jgi:copper chaperone